MKAFASTLVAAIGLLSLVSAATAAEIRVLTAGAMRAVIAAEVPAFEKKTGHTVVLQNDTAGGLAKRIAGGEAFDLAVITPRVVDDLIAAGKIVPGSRLDLARVGVGVGVKEGAPKPDIATV